MPTDRSVTGEERKQEQERKWKQERETKRELRKNGDGASLKKRKRNGKRGIHGDGEAEARTRARKVPSQGQLNVKGKGTGMGRAPVTRRGGSLRAVE